MLAAETREASRPPDLDSAACNLPGLSGSERTGQVEGTTRPRQAAALGPSSHPPPLPPRTSMSLWTDPGSEQKTHMCACMQT